MDARPEAVRPLPDLEERLSGCLLGTALGDALGLPCEGMSAPAIARRFGRVERFHLLLGTGFVSDDAEQSALMAQSLLRGPGSPEAAARAFRRSLLGWFLRLPFGIGLATVRASLRIALGLARSGVRSAGNGAAMRAAVVGVHFRDRPLERRAFGRALAETTHVDARAVEGALFVAEVAAACARASGPSGLEERRGSLREARAAVVGEASLGAAIDRALDLAERGAATEEAVAALGNTGFVVHTAALAAFMFARHGDAPLGAISETIAAGGDTDSIAAIVGAWAGARHGAAALPASLVGGIQDGPFGPGHQRALASALAALSRGERPAVPRYWAVAALARNLALYPVIIAHGLRRLVPL